MQDAEKEKKKWAREMFPHPVWPVMSYVSIRFSGTHATQTHASKGKGSIGISLEGGESCFAYTVKERGRGR
jgi:hypothetical protein